MSDVCRIRMRVSDADIDVQKKGTPCLSCSCVTADRQYLKPVLWVNGIMGIAGV